MNGISVEKYLQRLLTVQPTLDAQLFDNQEVMHSEIREKILNKADFLIKNTIAKFPEIVVDDIRLTGSTTSYFYHQNSDIDVKITIKNPNCSYITSQEVGFNEFINAIVNNFYGKNRSFYIGKRFIDMRMSTRTLDILGLYSIQNNQWIIKPNKNALNHINPTEIIKNYHERYEEIYSFINNFETNNGKYTIEQCNQMYEFYKEQIVDKNRTLETNIVYKLLNYKHVLKDINQIISTRYYQALSV